MLELQLPRPMPHALPRDPPFDFYHSATHKLDMESSMQLPIPRVPLGYEHDPLRSAPRAPLTPPQLPGSAVRVVSLPPNQGAGHQFGYQLPAIGNSRSVASHRDPTPPAQQQQHQQQQTQQPAQDMTPRKKYTISPNLQVPSTIITPQEGLPQLAAEVGPHLAKMMKFSD
jgi:hypothetical protein